MTKAKVIKEFPKGGALAKGPFGTVFVKNYWSEGLEFIYVDEKDINKGPKGLSVSLWTRKKPVTWQKIFSCPNERKKIKRWDFSGEIPSKKVTTIVTYDASEISEEVRESKDSLKASSEKEAFFYGDSIQVIDSTFTEVLSGEALASYENAIKEANELYEKNEKTTFSIYNIIGRIQDCLEYGKPYEETLLDIKKEVEKNIERYNKLLQKFANANFSLVEGE